jgi:hypothetical protein
MVLYMNNLVLNQLFCQLLVAGVIIIIVLLAAKRQRFPRDALLPAPPRCSGNGCPPRRT